MTLLPSSPPKKVKLSFTFSASGEKLVQIRGLKREDYHIALIPLLERSFVGSKESRVFDQLHFERPYDTPRWEYSRAGFIDDKLVAHVGIWRFDLQLVKGVILACGGIRDVCTDPGSRHLKLGHQMLDDSTRFMQGEQLDLSLLYAGPRKFYEAKGWHGTIPTPSFTLDLATLPAGIKGTGVTIEPFAGDEDTINELCILRQQSQANLSFVVIRDIAYFKRLLEANRQFPGARRNTYIMRDTRTRAIIGYMFAARDEAAGGTNMIVDEARLIHEAPGDAWLAVFRQARDMLGCKRIIMMLSANHDACKVAVNLGATDKSSVISGLMVKFIALDRFLQKLAIAVNMQVKNGIRKHALDLVADTTTTTIAMSILADDCPGAARTRFVIEVNKKRKAGPVRISLAPDAPAPSNQGGCIEMTEEALITLLANPSFTSHEAIGSDMVRVSGVDASILDLLFKGFSWDKERRDYF
jgi:predicted acetyltransferase